jgi:calcium-dependent protein kinase
MDHPNIVKLYEVFEDEESLYLVNEYCSGGEMFDRIKKQKKLSEQNISNAMKQILSAIVYCHKNNIVHRYLNRLIVRDLKPENVMYDNTSDSA